MPRAAVIREKPRQHEHRMAVTVRRLPQQGMPEGPRPRQKDGAHFAEQSPPGWRHDDPTLRVEKRQTHHGFDTPTTNVPGCVRGMCPAASAALVPENDDGMKAFARNLLDRR